MKLVMIMIFMQLYDNNDELIVFSLMFAECTPKNTEGEKTSIGISLSN